MSTPDPTLPPNAPTLDPYKVLSLNPTATAAEIRTAYRKLALTTHPDKAPASTRATAHTKFQELAFAYSILSDETRRRRYDQTGSTQESALDDEDFDWKTFFTEQFQAVGVEAIEEFRKEYQGGEEERRTLLDAYTASRGDLDVVFETVLASDVVADEARFRTIIDAAIAAGEVEAYTKYTKESAATKKRRRTAAAKEAKLAEAHAKQLGIHDELYAKKKETGEKRKKGGEIEEEDMGGLAAIIKSRQAGRMDAMIAGLEAKIASGGASKGKKKGGRRAQPLPPTDEEFEATRAKMEARKKKRRTKV